MLVEGLLSTESTLSSFLGLHLIIFIKGHLYATLVLLSLKIFLKELSLKSLKCYHV